MEKYENVNPFGCKSQARESYGGEKGAVPV